MSEKMTSKSLFSPTTYWDDKENTLVVVLDSAQIAALYHADLPDDSETARYGRELKKQIEAMQLRRAYHHGEASVRIVQRTYDGEPV